MYVELISIFNFISYVDDKYYLFYNSIYYISFVVSSLFNWLRLN